MPHITSLLSSKSIHQKTNIVKESIQIVVLFAITVFVVYFLPTIIGKIYIIAIVLVFWNSKKNYFWFAFFYVIINSPGNFFVGGDVDALYRLPLFTLTTGISLSTSDIFMLTALFKAIFQGKKFRYYLSGPFSLILGYSILLLLLSWLVYNTSILDILTSNLIRNFFFFSYLFSFPALVKKRDDAYKFIYLLFPFVFLIFFTSVFYFITGTYFVYLVDPNSVREMTLSISEGIFPRMTLHGIYLLLPAFIFSLLLTFNPQNSIKNNYYLYFIAVFSYISAVFMSAARIWFVVFSLITVVYFIKATKLKLFFSYALISIILLLGLSASQNLSEGLYHSWQRISSVFTIGQEESIATQSINSKVNDDLINMLKAIKQNPLIGWGFSNTFQKYGSSDVGNFNLILQVGLVGFMLFVYLWLKYLRMLSTAKKNLTGKNYLKKTFAILTISFISLLIAHFSTHQIFGLTMQNYTNYFLALFFIYSEFFVSQAFLYKKNIQNAQNLTLQSN